MTQQTLELREVTPYCGAEVHGLDLSQPLDKGAVDALKTALLDPATEVALVVADSGTIGPPIQTGDVLPRSNKSMAGIRRGCCVPQEAEPLSL